MHATRAAVEEGILPGGGVALLRSVKALGRLRTENHDQKTGIDIVRKALSTPARQIAINAGEDGSIVVGKISENDTYAYGYDAQEGQYGDLVSKGIIDPTKVVRTARRGADEPHKMYEGVFKSPADVHVTPPDDLDDAPVRPSQSGGHEPELLISSVSSRVSRCRRKQGPIQFLENNPIHKVVFGCASCAPRQGEIGFAVQL